ncbi:MAG: calcium-binding protein [Chitinophagales bacterium]
MSYTKDTEREDRIDELMAGCMDMEEVYVAWYYYFAENLDFPISAVARLKKRAGSKEDVEVRLVDVVNKRANNLSNLVFKLKNISVITLPF